MVAGAAAELQTPSPQRGSSIRIDDVTQRGLERAAEESFYYKYKCLPTDTSTFKVTIHS